MKTLQQIQDEAREKAKEIFSAYNAEILNKFQDEYLMEKGPGCEEILFPVLEKATNDFIESNGEFIREFIFKDFLSSTIEQAVKEAFEETKVYEKDDCICGLGTDGNDECMGQCSGGFNSALSAVKQKQEEFLKDNR